MTLALLERLKLRSLDRLSGSIRLCQRILKNVSIFRFASIIIKKGLSSRKAIFSGGGGMCM